MVNTKCKKCGLKYAGFGFPNSILSHCGECKEEGMIRRLYNSCIKCKTKVAIYKFPNYKKYTHCGSCKEEEMVIKSYFLCIICKKIIASFNIQGKGKATHCIKCKTDDMISVSKLCVVCNKIRPSYSLDGKSKTHCAKCKTKNMITHQQLCNICKMNRASYGIIINNKNIRTHCAKCKTDEMIFLNMEMCEKCNKTVPTFGYNKVTHCLKCKEPEMINLKSQRCKSEFCDIIVGNKYDGYCTHCFANLFPQNPKTLLIHKKSKELKVVSYIYNKFEGFVHDKPLYYNIKGGCCDSKRRIDLRKLVNNTMLCIEIDENQHKYYDKKNEINRYDDLFMDFSGKYIFIRYNPDKYKIGNKYKNPHFKTRIEILCKEIEKQLNRIISEDNKELVESIYLFYDQ